MSKHISYDGKNDILSIHKGFSSDEKFKGNIDAGSLILDISTKGRVRGIEILDATEFFGQFEVSQNMLNQLKDATFEAIMKPTGIMLGIKLKVIGQEVSTKIAVPLNASY